MDSGSQLFGLSFFSPFVVVVAATAKRSLLFKIETEVVRFGLYAGILALTSAYAKSISIAGVPFLYIELILLAPFFRFGWANTLMWLSILTSIFRLIQGFYGYDQLFISIYLLFVNIGSFPVWVQLMILVAISIGVFLMFYANRFIPRYIFKCKILFFLFILFVCVGIKIQEDNSRSNLIGTSFGYLMGNLRFSEMFYGPYQIPMLSKFSYPAQMGAEHAIKHGLNLTLIVVESMGVPSDGLGQKYLFYGFDSPDIKDKYTVTQSVVPARGSTIHGEIRELCGGRLSHGLFGESRAGCIPEMMKQAGYQTTAIHANYAKMYGRDVWYPKIGFQNYINTDSGGLPYDQTNDRWGTALDTSVFEWISSQNEQEKKYFDYILTVSTHLPPVMLPGARVWTECRNKMTTNACTHMANLRLVVDKIIEYAIKRKNTTFVIVGDHPPPFVSPTSRAGFIDSEVPYVILQPK